jgi:two-component system LytT family response regulator
MIRATMKEIERRLDPRHFVRVHRSALVNVDHIERLEPRAHGEFVIHLRDGTRLASSGAHSARLHALLR